MELVKLFIQLKIYIGIWFVVILVSCRPSEPINIPASPQGEKYHVDTLHQELDGVVNETSGIMILDSTLWTINDSGGRAIIYNIDMKTGSVIREVEIKGGENTDWEELTYDHTFFYIGNFGNNLGKRDDLVIHKGTLQDLFSSETVEVENIYISYTDQTQYYNGYDHNHDCEAMLVYQDSLYLFSKNWKDQQCKLYQLPTTPGRYELDVKYTFDTKGTITAAALSPYNKSIVLLGYVAVPRKGFDPFVWVLENWKGDNFFGGDARRYDFPTRRQMESVDFITEKQIIITAEDERGKGPSMYSFRL